MKYIIYIKYIYIYIYIYISLHLVIINIIYILKLNYHELYLEYI